MRFCAFLTALAIGISLPLFAASAPAQEKDAVVEMARKRFAEGVKYFDQKRYEEARVAFMQAYALKRHPALLLNLGLSEVRSGHPLEASRHFSAYLKESPNASAAERSEAEKGLAAARTKLGRIQITVNVAGAEVLVDGESVGQSPLAEPVDALPGTRSVVAKFSGRMAQADVSVTVEPIARGIDRACRCRRCPACVRGADRRSTDFCFRGSRTAQGGVVWRRRQCSFDLARALLLLAHSQRRRPGGSQCDGDRIGGWHRLYHRRSGGFQQRR
jgi:tetratricopeptide (TPR) repeat protein